MSSSPPGGEPEGPNQFRTPCCVIYRWGDASSPHQLCSDLQEAYNWARDMVNINVERGEYWTLKSWENTIQGVLESYRSNRLLYEVASGPDKSVYIYYHI